MGLRTGIARLLGFEVRKVPDDAYLDRSAWDLINGSTSPTVDLCIDRIAGTLSSLPIFLQRTGKDLEHKNMLVYLLGYRPNSYQTIAQFIRALVSVVLETGNGFIRVQRDNAKRPCGLHVVDKVTHRIENGEKHYYRDGTRIADHVIHIHMGILEGESPKARIESLIKLENALLDFARGYFSNGLDVTTIITVPQGEDTKSKEAYEAFKSRVRSEFTGAKKHGIPIFKQAGVEIDSKEAKNARNAMLVESMEYVRSEIARHFHIPTGLLDSKSANNSILENETRQYYQQAILPLATVILQGLNDGLCDSYWSGIVAQFDYAVLLKPSPDIQSRCLNTYRFAGILNQNECREELGYESVEGGDEFYVPSNLGVAGANGDATQGKNRLPTDSNNQPV